MPSYTRTMRSRTVKSCKKCLVAKPLTDFTLRKEGCYRGACKACLNSYYRDLSKRPARKAARKAYVANHRDMMNRSNAKYRAANKEKASAALKARRHSVHGMQAAHNAVTRAVQNGSLERQACQTCGNKKAHAHHPNYSKPLEVVWLCPLHHKAAHATAH